MNTEKLVTKRLEATRDNWDYTWETPFGLYTWTDPCDTVFYEAKYGKMRIGPIYDKIIVSEDERNLDDVSDIVNDDHQERIKILLDGVLECYFENTLETEGNPTTN
jgi:hypothetical protein